MKKTNQQLDAEVAALYDKYPFPSHPIDSLDDVYKTQIYRLIYPLTKQYLDQHENKNIKVLDAGCGTGELLLGLAKPTWKLEGFDQNQKSIDEARSRAARFNLPNINFQLKNLTSEIIAENSYDFVYSIGVLHHLAYPEAAFEKLVKATKSGGYITIGLYNPFGRAQIRLHRLILDLLVGEDIEKRVGVAEKLFFRKKLTSSEKIYVADLYAHPRERYFTVENMLDWFKRYNIEFLDATPPVTLRKNAQLIRQIVKDFREGRVDRIYSWQQIAGEGHGKKPSVLESQIIQYIWILLGMGQMVHMIGRKR